MSEILENRTDGRIHKMVDTRLLEIRVRLPTKNTFNQYIAYYPCFKSLKPYPDMQSQIEYVFCRSVSPRLLHLYAGPCQPTSHHLLGSRVRGLGGRRLYGLMYMCSNLVSWCTETKRRSRDMTYLLYVPTYLCLCSARGSLDVP